MKDDAAQVKNGLEFGPIPPFIDTEITTAFAHARRTLVPLLSAAANNAEHVDSLTGRTNPLENPWRSIASIVQSYAHDEKAITGLQEFYLRYRDYLARRPSIYNRIANEWAEELHQHTSDSQDDTPPTSDEVAQAYNELNAVLSVLEPPAFQLRNYLVKTRRQAADALENVATKKFTSSQFPHDIAHDAAWLDDVFLVGPSILPASIVERLPGTTTFRNFRDYFDATTTLRDVLQRPTIGVIKQHEDLDSSEAQVLDAVAHSPARTPFSPQDEARYQTALNALQTRQFFVAADKSALPGFGGERPMPMEENSAIFHMPPLKGHNDIRRLLDRAVIALTKEGAYTNPIYNLSEYAPNVWDLKISADYPLTHFLSAVADEWVIKQKIGEQRDTTPDTQISGSEPSQKGVVDGGKESVLPRQP